MTQPGSELLIIPTDRGLKMISRLSFRVVISHLNPVQLLARSAPPTPSFVRPQNNVNIGGGANQFRRDTQPSPLSQPRSVITSNRSDAIRSNAGISSAPAISPARSIGNFSNANTPPISTQRVTPKLNVQPRMVPVAADVQTNTIDRTKAADVRKQLNNSVINDKINLPGRTQSNFGPTTNPKLGISKFEVAADNTKSTDKSTDNSDKRPIRQNIRQQVQSTNTKQ